MQARITYCMLPQLTVRPDWRDLHPFDIYYSSQGWPKKFWRGGRVGSGGRRAGIHAVLGPLFVPHSGRKARTFALFTVYMYSILILFDIMGVINVLLCVYAHARTCLSVVRLVHLLITSTLTNINERTNCKSTQDKARFERACVWCNPYLA
jgi:hypothetical protein